MACNFLKAMKQNVWILWNKSTMGNGEEANFKKHLSNDDPKNKQDVINLLNKLEVDFGVCYPSNNSEIVNRKAKNVMVKIENQVVSNNSIILFFFKFVVIYIAFFEWSWMLSFVVSISMCFITPFEVEIMLKF